MKPTTYKERRAFEMRSLCYSFQDIADELGWQAPTSAEDAVKRYMKKNPPDPEIQKNTQRRMEATFEAMKKKFAADLESDDFKIRERAAGRQLSIMKLQMQLHGLGETNINLGTNEKSPLRINLGKTK
jgi:hypothetical protein